MTKTRVRDSHNVPKEYSVISPGLVPILVTLCGFQE
jgi:hypothetical protein